MKQEYDPHEHKLTRADFSEFFAAKEAYDRLRLFLAKCTPVVGFIYGLITWNLYFITLGALGIFLFWVLERMDQSQS